MKSRYDRAGILHILQAAFEYLISLLVTGSFLATLTKSIGLSDSTTGILSAVISLGCVFQLFSASLRGRRKPLILALSIVNQIFFLLLYLLPLSHLSENIKSGCFVATIFLAYLIYYVAHPKKTNWMMQAVDPANRGRFTADKEIFSLIVGMTFTFAMGRIADHFLQNGEKETAFLISAGVILLLTLCHTGTMFLFPSEPKYTIKTAQEQKKGSGIRRLLTNRKVLLITDVFVLWNIANYAAIPFYGTYQIGELGFSLTFVSILAILCSVARMLVSRAWGRYADRASFAVMVRFCFLIMAAGFAFAAMATPANGKVMFILYYLCSGVAMGGISSSLTNLIYDEVEPEKCENAIALCQSFSGVSGFLSTLFVSFLVDRMQKNGNTLFGIPLYAQQAVSILALLFTLGAALHVHLTLTPKKQKNADTSIK